jgi:aldose 1-epimerase
MALAGLAVLLVAAVGFSGALASNTHKSGSPTVTKEPFGSVNGKAVDIYTLTNSNGMEVKILTYGGIIQSVKVPDRQKHFENVTLGFDNLTDYVERSPYFGCITGRYANRIALGRFTLDGVTYQLPITHRTRSTEGPSASTSMSGPRR